MRRYIQYALLSIVAISLASCEEELAQKDGVVQFTVREKNVSYNNAVISVKHNGPEDITWYGFLTDDVTTQESRLIYDKRNELLRSGGKIDIIRDSERNILLEGLEEDTSYKYIVFGLTADGERPKNVGNGSVKFSTTQNVYVMTETKDWTINYLGRNEAKDKELIEIVANKGGRFAWQYVSKTSIEEFDKTYKNGYELWEDDIYMTTVNGIQLYALEQITTIQYYITQHGYKASDLTYVYEEGKPFEVDRLTSGEYYIIVYGFMGDGQHTQKYSVAEISIPEEEADEAYTKWLGTYTFSGEVEVTQDNGDVVRETRTYDIKIEKYDNNYMYRIHGWECGEDVKYDWEEDIMQLDKSKDEYLAFPAYYKNGNLEIRESPMTYITFDGSNALILGIYGYAYNKEQKEEIPVILDGTPMASATPVENIGESTVLNGLKETVEFDKQKVEIEYCKMGYIAWNETSSAWQTINPPMRFPITITRTESAESGTSIPATPAAAGLELFDAVKIAPKVIKKDYSGLDRVKPETFKQVIY